MRRRQTHVWILHQGESALLSLAHSADLLLSHRALSRTESESQRRARLEATDLTGLSSSSNPAGIVCNYDEPERGEKRKRGAGGITKVQALEAKIGRSSPS